MATIFLICFLVGVGISAVSLVASFAHLHHHGGLHFGHHGGNFLTKSASSMLGHLFSFAGITMFVTWFGGIGLLLEEMTSIALGIVILVAVLAGGVSAATINRVLAALRARERPLEPISLIGTIGKLTVPIREGGTGEIVYTIEGKRRCSGARSDDGRALTKGAEVVITRYDKGIAYVCEFEALARIEPQSIALR